MKLLLIQIGDIHFKEGSNPASSRFHSVAIALKHLAPDVTSVVVVLSGDIAFSGRKEEYKIASDNLEAMLADITAEMKGAPVHVVGIPGNHDCDFKHHITGTRKLLLEGLARSSREKADENTLGICCQVQDEFFKFLDEHETLKPAYGVPTGGIYDLNDKFKDNVFCSRLLSRLVLHHFYLFNTSEQTKQKICSKLGIKMQTLRGIDVTTSSQKRLPEKSGS
jgi:Calcineurin-like phosphoesterase